MSEKTIINLTPHSITICSPGTASLEIPSTGLARVEEELIPVDEINGFPVYRRVLGEVTGLPEPQDGVVYVVSPVVTQACPERDDIYSPGLLIRNDCGIIVGCCAFLTPPPPVDARIRDLESKVCDHVGHCPGGE